MNGYTLPVDLDLTSRGSGDPKEYVATRMVDLDTGFESGDGDNVTVYIADTAYAGTGNGDGGIAGSGKYRYGFNGKEKDDEVKGIADQIDYGMRIYDPRVGKFLSIDPLQKSYPWYTPYQFAGNTPIWASDMDGMEPDYKGSGEGQTGTTTTYKGFAPGAYGLEKQTWYWHAGSGEYGTKAGWYDQKGYQQVLTPIANDLAGFTGSFSPAANGGNTSTNHNWTSSEKQSLANTKLGRFIGNGLSKEAASNLLASAKSYSIDKNTFVTGAVPASSFNVEDMVGVGMLLKEGLSSLARVIGQKTFYSVQSESSIARLMLGGEPWPVGPTKAHLGEGLYAWGTREEAEAYLKVKSQRGIEENLKIVKFSLSNRNYDALSKYFIPQNEVGEKWLSVHSSLYGEGVPHGFQYIRGNTNFGHEHFFSSDIFHLLKLHN